jgi:hypothetical protein
MSEHELVKKAAELLRRIIRSVDKKLDYSLVEHGEQGVLMLRLSTRGREGFVRLRTDDLLDAGESATRLNAVRQKIKSKRDHLLSNYVVDVMGTKVAKMLKRASATRDEFKPLFSRRPPMGRRR